MIECRKSGAFEDVVTLTCSKMKDDAPFADIEIGLKKVDVSGGRTSLVAGPPPSFLQRTLRTEGSSQLAKQGDQIVEALAQSFGELGAAHGELRKAYCLKTRASPSTFDRAFREVAKSGRVRKVGEGKNVRYFPISISVKVGVSGCHDSVQIGVMSPPSLGG